MFSDYACADYVESYGSADELFNISDSEQFACMMAHLQPFHTNYDIPVFSATACKYVKASFPL